MMPAVERLRPQRDLGNWPRAWERADAYERLSTCKKYSGRTCLSHYSSPVGGCSMFESALEKSTPACRTLLLQNRNVECRWTWPSANTLPKGNGFHASHRFDSGAAAVVAVAEKAFAGRHGQDFAR